MNVSSDIETEPLEKQPDTMPEKVLVSPIGRPAPQKERQLSTDQLSDDTGRTADESVESSSVADEDLSTPKQDTGRSLIPPPSPSTMKNLGIPQKSAMRRVSSYGSRERLGENIPLKFERRRCSLVLPVPQSLHQKRDSDFSWGSNSSFPSANSSEQQLDEDAPPTPRKSVGFSQIHIREHEQTLGDNPSCMYGAPISLDWNYQERESLSISAYEDQRVRPRRSMQQMHLNSYTRKYLLQDKHTEDEIRQAKKDTNKFRGQRSATRALLPLMKFEEVVESAGRKAKRLLGSSKKGKLSRATSDTTDVTGDSEAAGAMQRSMSMSSMRSHATVLSTNTV